VNNLPIRKMADKNHGKVATKKDHDLMKKELQVLELKVSKMTEIFDKVQPKERDEDFNRLFANTMVEHVLSDHEFVDFLGRKQAPDESVDVYLDTKWRLYQRCNPNWKTAYFPHVKCEIIKGLFNPRVKERACSSRALTFAQLSADIGQITKQQRELYKLGLEVGSMKGLNPTEDKNVHKTNGACPSHGANQHFQVIDINRKINPNPISPAQLESLRTAVMTVFIDRSDYNDDDEPVFKELESDGLLACSDDDEEDLEDIKKSYFEPHSDDPTICIPFKVSGKTAIGLALISTGSEHESMISEDFAKAIALPLVPASLRYKAIAEIKIKTSGESCGKLAIILENISRPIFIKPVVVKNLIYPLLIGTGVLYKKENEYRGINFSVKPATLSINGGTATLCAFSKNMLTPSKDARLRKVQNLCRKAGMKEEYLKLVYIK